MTRRSLLKSICGGLGALILGQDKIPIKERAKTDLPIPIGEWVTVTYVFSSHSPVKIWIGQEGEIREVPIPICSTVNCDSIQIFPTC